MLPTIVLAALAPRRVTVEFAPLPLPQALARLSAVLGERLECAAALRDEPLVLRLRDADGDRALREIAGLYDARWEPRPGGRLLVRDPDALRRRAKAARDEDLATLRGSVAYLRRRLAEQPARYGPDQVRAQREGKAREDAARKKALADKDYANAFTASSALEETPAWRAIARIVPLLGEAELLALPNDSRTVWAETPTRAQRAFPSEAEDVLRRYRDELTAFRPGKEASRVRLVLKRWESGAAFNVELVAVDEKGKAVDAASARMANDTDRLKKRSTTFDDPKPLPGERPLALPPEIVEYRKVMNARDESPERGALLSKWRPILADPVRNEPTRWVPGGETVAVATALDENLVGAPSEITGAKYDRSPAGETPSGFVHRHGRYDGLTERDGWLILAPRRPLARSRAEARALIRSAVAHGGVLLDEASVWAAGTDQPFPFVDWVGDALGTTLLGGGGGYDTMAALLDARGLRLWDALGPATRESLRGGARVDLGRLSAQAQDWIVRLAYWYEGVGGEPTETLPNGIDGGTVAMTYAETPIAVLSSSKEPMGNASMPLDAAQLGRYLAKGDPYREVKAEAYRAYDRYRMGVSRAYTLHFRLGHEGVPMDVELDENLMDPKAPLLDAPPAAFAQATEAARAKAAAEPEPAKAP